MKRISPYYPTGVYVGSEVFQTARRAEKARRSLWEYTRQAWPVVDPAEFRDNWHVGAICEHLQAVSRKQIHKLIINCPPGVAKSTLVSVMWPSWEWVDAPGEQSLFGSYDPDLALRDSVKCRNVLDSSWYRGTFQPQWRFSKDQNAKGFYTNTVNGNRYTFGVKAGGKTGWRGNKVVLDDPNSAADRFDARVKMGTYDTFNSVLSTRVNDLLTSAFIIIQQRLADDDMTGLLLGENEDLELMQLADKNPHTWVHLKLPMTATSRPCSTVIGWTDPRKEGESLFPGKFPPDAVRVLEKRLGADGTASQLQQEPVPGGGRRFTKEFFQHWYDLGRGGARLVRRGGREELVNLNTCWTFVTVDLAASEEQSADFTVFSIWAVTKKFDLLLLDRYRGQWSEPEAVSTAVEIYSIPRYNDNRHSCFVVESNGVGLPIVKAMQARGLPVLPVHIHRTDKAARSATAVIRLQSGQLFWPDPRTPWYNDPKEGWEIEHLRFPAFPHDDQVDTTNLAAEAVYEAGVCGYEDVEKLTPDAKDYVERVFGRGKVAAHVDSSLAKKFFGIR